MNGLRLDNVMQIGDLTSVGITFGGVNDSRLHSWICKILISKLVSILFLNNGNKKRHTFCSIVKRQVVHNQNGKCGNCKRFVKESIREFHHKDSNRTNNKISNCQMLCANCHSMTTRRKCKPAFRILWGRI